MTTLTHIDTACVLLEVAGLRLLTDPVFDPPGRRYWFGWGSSSRKTGTPALSPAEVGTVDAVLLSHHQHGDNLDTAGRAFATAAPIVLTTPAGRRRFPGNAMAVTPAVHVALPVVDAATTRAARPSPRLIVTGSPARHRPAWIPSFVAGPATGFILESDDLPRGPLMITGDTVLFGPLREAAARVRPDILVIHVGAVRVPYLSGPARFTMNAAEAAELAGISGARLVVAIHTSGWTHFREGPEALGAAFERAGLPDRLRIPVPGVPISLD